MRRCFLCRSDMLGSSDRSLRYPDGSQRSFPIACGSCGVLVAEAADAETCWRDFEARLRRPTFTSDTSMSYGLDLYTLRSAATRLARGVRPVDRQGRAELLAPHGKHAARGALFDLHGDARIVSARATVSLGLLCRESDIEAVLMRMPVHAAWTRDAVILVDGDGGLPRSVGVAGFPADGVRIATRPLAGDFAAQRNALHDLARLPWMLQLDADERLDPSAGILLPALAALAEDGQVRSIGLARRNYVDGVLSDVYPDVQYRLNRTSLRYAGRVHERPECGGWQHSLISLHGTIAHDLDGVHVRARSQRYEVLDPGRGRLEEEAALLRPYRD